MTAGDGSVPVDVAKGVQERAQHPETPGRDPRALDGNGIRCPVATNSTGYQSPV